MIDIKTSHIFNSLKGELGKTIESFTPEEQKLVLDIFADYSRMTLNAFSQGNPAIEKAHLEAQMANLKGRAAEETKKVMIKVGTEIISSIAMKAIPLLIAAI